MTKNDKNRKILGLLAAVTAVAMEIWQKLIKSRIGASKHGSFLVLWKKSQNPIHSPQIGFEAYPAAHENWFWPDVAGSSAFNCGRIPNIFAPGASYGSKLSGGTPFVVLWPLWKELRTFSCDQFLEFGAGGGSLVLPIFRGLGKQSNVGVLGWNFASGQGLCKSIQKWVSQKIGSA